MVEAALAAAARVRTLLGRWEPPDFAHVSSPEMALLMTAIDHKTGYTRPHVVDGRGPFEGSELMWEIAALQDEGFFAPTRIAEIDAASMADAFRAGDESLADCKVRARLWREIAAGLIADYDSSARALLDAAGARLAGETGLLARLGGFEAYADPLAKKAQLFAKIADRRGWFAVADPENWEVSADNVLMRLALRSGLVEPGPLAEVRIATREAFKELATEVGVAPPVLDDLLWELGRDDPDLLGAPAGDLSEPPREGGVHWY